MFLTMLKKFWNELSLTQQFSVAAGIVMLAGMGIMGFWVERQIHSGVTDNAATSTALFMDSFIAPLAREMKDGETLSAGPVIALDELIQTPAVVDRILSVKIWAPSGMVVYSDDRSLIGEVVELSPGLKRALEGEVVAEFHPSGNFEGGPAVVAGHPTLEIYSPVRKEFSSEVIGVVEFYELAPGLARTLDSARQQSWMVVAAVTAGMALALFGIVHSGARLIEKQRRSLQRALDQNSRLLRRIERASGRSAALTEQQLRRVSADLHDGPAQLVSLAALRIGSLPLDPDNERGREETDAISAALNEAMQDIRNICKGLSLPEIESQSLHEVIRSAVSSHEAHTSTGVDVLLNVPDGEVPAHIKICIYRFLQEGLNNAYRHGLGAGQRVVAEVTDDNMLRLQVFNDLSVEENGASSDGSKRLGLVGLRERVEALGGRFEFEKIPGDGARLQMEVGLGAKGLQDE